LHTASHAPLPHAAAALGYGPQEVPHAPQWPGSKFVLVQEAPHGVRPAPQEPAHVLVEQTCPALQALPHEPQFAGS
jgi:hypothetical protein